MTADVVNRAFPKAQLKGCKSDVQLADSGLTAGWLLETLWQHCVEFCEAIGKGSVTNITSRDISEGKGFVSKVYKTAICLDNAPTDSFTVMMKVPTTECIDKILEEVQKEDGKVPDTILDVFDCHNVECKVYDLFRDIECIPLPTVWYTRQASKDTVGVILVKDLSLDNICLGMVSSVTVQQAKNANRYIAAFHKHLLCMSDADAKKVDAIPHTRQLHLDDYGTDFHRDIIDKILEYQTGELREMIAKLLPAMTKEFAVHSMLDRPTQLGVPLLLCHGDTGAHNLFFKKAADGTASNEIGAFIDWQIAFKGNPMLDINRILYAFCDPEVRREVELTVVEDYYEALKSELAKEDRTLDFTVEQLREVYALAAVHQASEMGIRMPFIIDFKKDEFSPEVLEAWRHKYLLRAKFAMRDAIEYLRKYAPKFLAE